MLKSVENLGVSYVKGTEQYQSKLEAELRKLKFSYRVSKGEKKWDFPLWFSGLRAKLVTMRMPV